MDLSKGAQTGLGKNRKIIVSISMSFIHIFVKLSYYTPIDLYFYS